jgi:hypothetical protein
VAIKNNGVLSKMMRYAIPYWRSGGTQTGAGIRDMYRVFGWKDQLCYEDFFQMYTRQDIAGRIIDAPIKGLWSDPPSLSAENKEFTDKWMQLLETVPLWERVQRLDRLAGLGSYAIMVVGLDDGKALEQPVSGRAQRKVIYLQPWSEDSAEIIEYEANPASPRFGKPTMYQIDPQVDDNLKSATARSAFSRSFKVHYSRVLHVAEGCLESSVIGHSRLEPVFNVLCDVLKVSGASAETYWLAGNRGLHINVDKELELEDDDEEALTKEVEEYANEQRRVIRTRGVEVNSLGSEVADPRPAFDVQISLLSARTGIPKRMLMGSEAGQLASQQDRAEWAQRCQERISDYGGPVVLYPLLKMLIELGILPDPKKLEISWPDPFKMNPLERAQTSAQMARSAVNIARAQQTVDQMNITWAEKSTDQETQVPGAFGQPGETQKIPAVVRARPPIVLLSTEEARSIIGFGKHPPVFESEMDADRPATEPVPGE